MDNAKKIIECSICEETFSDPRVLPCQHTFCLKCLEVRYNVEQPENKLSCPLCHNECMIPEGGLSRLTRNCFLQKLLEIEYITADNNKSIPCEGCYCEDDSGKEGSPIPEASVYCFDCQQHFCCQCHKAHGNMRFNKSHKVIKLFNLQPDGLMQMTLSFCENHPDEPVNHYCLDCKTVICLPCYLKEHSTHKCSSIGEEAEHARKQMQEDVASVTEQYSKLLTVANEIKIEKEILIDEIKSKKDEVIQRLNEVKDLHDKQADSLEKELNSIQQMKMRELETAEGLNEQRQLLMESFTGYVKEVINQATDAELLRCASTMATRAADLKAMPAKSDFSAVKIDWSTQSGVVGSIKQRHSNSFVKDTLLLHPDQLPAMEKISVNQFCRMTTLGNEMYFLSPRNKISLKTTKLCIVLPSSTVKDLQNIKPAIVGIPQKQTNPYFAQLQENQPVISVTVQPVYYETDGSSHFKLIFSDMQICTNLQASAVARITISENDILWKTHSVKNRHVLVMPIRDDTTMALDVEISYTKSTVEITASNPRISEKSSSLMSVKIEKAIPEIYSMLEIHVYDDSTYKLQRRMNFYARTRKQVVITDMRSCSYYNCIYIGDHGNSLIHKFESLGSSSQIKLKEAPIGLSVTKLHTLLVGCSTNKISEFSTDGALIKDISLSILVKPFVLNGTTIREISWIFPRHVFRLDGDQYLVTGDFPTSGVISKEAATDRTTFRVFLVDANGAGKPLGSAEVVDIAVDQHGCILVLLRNNKLQIRNIEESCKIKEIDLSDHSLSGCDQMHFDAVRGRLYLGTSDKPGLSVIEIK